MKRPAAFFDRDNTLIVSDGYLGDPTKVVLVDGAAEAVARVRALGFATVVFSNQSGVARGMFAEDAVHAVNARMDEQLLDANPAAVIDRHEFCPFHPEGTVEAFRQESHLRKPRPGMIHQAAEKLALDLGRSWVIGDAPRDVEAGHAAGCRTILVHDPSLPPSPAARSASDVEPNFVVNSLREAVDVIAREIGAATPPEVSGGAEALPANNARKEEAPGPRLASPSKPTDVERPAQRTVPSPTPAPVPTPAPAPAPPHTERPKPNPEPAPTREEAKRNLKPPAEPTPIVAALKEKLPLERVGDPASTEGVEALLEQILIELRRDNEQPVSDFSVSRLFAGIVQVIALAALFLSYFREGQPQLATLLVALTLQAFTVALLIMGRQR
ncbi:MAG TPA: HAD family hydrolase [Tepidisphaeraceae bacterium]|nr:HAD family hydrolase [Tepidisphaeraceae bacterium]